MGVVVAPAVALAQAPLPGCLDGRVPDAAGHCCWPGQLVGEQSGTCRGAPQCPARLAAEGEDCRVPACAPGQVATPDAMHCCWPNQEWSHVANACIGLPQCPSGFAPRPDGATCDAVPPPPPPPTLPPCVAPNATLQGRCLSASELADAQSTERWGKSSLVFGLGYGFVGAPVGRVAGHSFEGTLGFHFPGVPLLLNLGGSIGSYTSADLPCSADDGCTGTPHAAFFTWRVGGAFAPFQGPEEKGWSFSPLNPFVGVDVLGLYFNSPATGCGPLCGHTAAPGNSIVPALTLGDVIFVDDQSFMLRLSLSANRDGLVCTASVELPGLLVLLMAAAL